MAIRETINKVLDRNTARQLAVVFMEMYKKGIHDAYEADDCGLVREHIDLLANHKNFGYVGTIRDSHTYWENRIIDIAEDKNFRKIMLKYFDRLDNKGAKYLIVALVLAKEFYIRGLNDWLEHPAENMLSRFDNQLPAWWTPTGIKKIDKFHIRAYVQDRCDSHIASIRDGARDIATESQYTQFKMTFSFALVSSV